MKKIITTETFGSFLTREIPVLMEQLHHDHDLPRGIAVNVIGLRIHEDYTAYSALLLKEMNDPIQFKGVRLGIKTAWNIAVVLAENLKEEDYPKLQLEFKKWEEPEQTDLLYWLKDHPEQRNILEKGKK